MESCSPRYVPFYQVGAVLTQAAQDSFDPPSEVDVRCGQAPHPVGSLLSGVAAQVTVVGHECVLVVSSAPATPWVWLDPGDWGQRAPCRRLADRSRRGKDSPGDSRSECEGTGTSHPHTRHVCGRDRKEGPPTIHIEDAKFRVMGAIRRRRGSSSECCRRSI